MENKNKYQKEFSMLRFSKQNEQSETCFSYAIKRSRRMKSKFSLPHLAAYGRITHRGSGIC